MKITTWIRPDPNDPTGRTITLRTDYKLEDRDNPVIQRYGRKLLAALEGTTDPDEADAEVRRMLGELPAVANTSAANPMLRAFGFPAVVPDAARNEARRLQKSMECAAKAALTGRAVGVTKPMENAAEMRDTEARKTRTRTRDGGSIHPRTSSCQDKSNGAASLPAPKPRK